MEEAVMQTESRQIDVGSDFYYRLVYRDERLGDRLHNARAFRKKYLIQLDNKDAWEGNPAPVIFDFSNVLTIGPSFASEAFAHFTQYATPQKIRQVIQFINISFVHKTIIDEEIDSGFSSRD
jgi:hypothetical protein